MCEDALTNIDALADIDWRAGQDAVRIGLRRIDDHVIRISAAGHQFRGLIRHLLHLRPQCCWDG